MVENYRVYMSNEVIAGVITESTAHVARKLIAAAGDERSTCGKLYTL